MYGWIQQTLEDLVREKFGEEAWTAVKENAGLGHIPTGGFARHEYYSDEVTLRLVAGASKVLELELAAVLELFGRYFITWMMKNGYASMLRNQGTCMQDFLQSMDAMHHGLQISLPHLIPPKMSCRIQGADLILHYTSTREGLAPMLAGLVKGAGAEIYCSEYTCEILEQWDTQGPSGGVLHHTNFIVTVVKGKGLRRKSTVDDVKSMAVSFGRSRSKLSSGRLNLRSKEQEHAYGFFQQNVAMSGAWTQIMSSRVQKLRCDGEVASFGFNFDIHELTSLLATNTTQASLALTGLFRKPLSREGWPLPHYGYISGAGGMDGMWTQKLPYVSMHEGVTMGSNPMVVTRARPGMHQVPMDISVCVIPNPTAGGWLFRALADTPNRDVLGTVVARALILSGWVQVKPRVLFDLFLDVVIVAQVTMWGAMPEYTNVGWPFLAVCLVKEIGELLAELLAYRRRRWLHLWCSKARVCQVCALALFVYLLHSILLGDRHPDVAESVTSRLPLALFTCVRWWMILWSLRGFVAFGPKILPIIYTLASMGPFTLCMVMLTAGFLSAITALEGSGLRTDVMRMIYDLGFVNEMGTVPEELWDTQWFYPSFVCFTVTITIIMVNILVGVLSESYDMHQDNASEIFGREQARVALSTQLRLWPVKKFLPHLHGLQALFFIEEPDDWISVQRDCYLWVCMPLNVAETTSRLNILKRHMDQNQEDTSRRFDEMQRSAEHSSEQLDELKKLRRLDDLYAKLESLDEVTSKVRQLEESSASSRGLGDLEGKLDARLDAMDSRIDGMRAQERESAMKLDDVHKVLMHEFGNSGKLAQSREVLDKLHNSVDGIKEGLSPRLPGLYPVLTECPMRQVASERLHYPIDSHRSTTLSSIAGTPKQNGKVKGL